MNLKHAMIDLETTEVFLNLRNKNEIKCRDDQCQDLTLFDEECEEELNVDFLDNITLDQGHYKKCISFHLINGPTIEVHDRKCGSSGANFKAMCYIECKQLTS